MSYPLRREGSKLEVSSWLVYVFILWRRQQVVTLRDIQYYMDMHSSASAKINIRKRKQKKENENKNHKKSGRKLTHFPKKMFSTHQQNQ